MTFDTSFEISFEIGGVTSRYTLPDRLGERLQTAAVAEPMHGVVTFLMDQAVKHCLALAIGDSHRVLNAWVCDFAKYKKFFICHDV
jgi:hypothetical protein